MVQNVDFWSLAEWLRSLEDRYQYLVVMQFSYIDSIYVLYRWMWWIP